MSLVHLVHVQLELKNYDHLLYRIAQNWSWVSLRMKMQFWYCWELVLMVTQSYLRGFHKVRFHCTKYTKYYQHILVANRILRYMHTRTSYNHDNVSIY